MPLIRFNSKKQAWLGGAQPISTIQCRGHLGETTRWHGHPLQHVLTVFECACGNGVGAVGIGFGFCEVCFG